MPQTLTSINLHVIFATKSREPSITIEVMPELHAYLGGIARNLDAVALAIGGVADHVHLLISVPAKLSTSDLVGKLKSNSSRWMHERGLKSFAWQTGYGAFSVSKSNVEQVREYVMSQEQHHQRMTFQEEFLRFLERHHVAYDPEYIWD